MKNLVVIALCCFAGLTVSASAQKNGGTKEKQGGALTMKTFNDSLNYAIGIQVGNTLKAGNIDLSADAFLRGIQDVLKGGTPLLSQDELQRCLGTAQQQITARQQAEKAKSSEKNQREGAEFLAKNKQRKGVITTASGLQYEVITEGTGKMPTDTNEVSVHYKGTLIDGTTFDSSIDRGEPVSFPVRGVIAGWTEALKLMKEGAVYKLYIPADLAYGEQGSGPIGPNSVLIFEVRLLSVK